MNHLGHRQRLRERFDKAPESLAEYEILELILGYVLTRKDTKPIAKEMLRRCGSLRGVLQAKPADLEDIPSVGPGVRVFLTLMQDFMTRAAEAPLKAREELCSPESVARMARQRLGALGHEEMWVAFVDSQNKLLLWERAAKGTVNSTSIYPREIIARALAVKAAGLFLVHNHPGGSPAPSGSDMELTRQVQEAGAPLHIRLMDHVVVTENLCYSTATDGLIVL